MASTSSTALRWLRWFAFGPVDYPSLSTVLLESRRWQHLLVALPWSLPVCFMACMTGVVVEYGNVAGFMTPCDPAPNATLPTGWLPARCELPVLEISTYAAVPKYSWEESAGARHAFLAAALVVALHLSILCPLRVALLEYQSRVPRPCDTAMVDDSSQRRRLARPRRCCCGLCCPSFMGALWLFRIHLLLIAGSMVAFIAMPFFPCCGKDDSRHRLVASATVQGLIFGFIFDICACTQILRHGVHDSVRAVLTFSTVWGAICLAISTIFSLIWTAKRWICVGDGYVVGDPQSEGMCTLVFASEWLLVLFLLFYFLPTSVVIIRLSKLKRIESAEGTTPPVPCTPSSLAPACA